MLCGGEPVIEIGPHCSSPYGCDYARHCWQHIPHNSVFDFSDCGRSNSFELYRQGIIKMEDVPRASLGWRQQLQLDGTLQQKNHVNQDAIRKFIGSLNYPLYFMDFETTCLLPLPAYDGVRPYQQAPFQFSLHWQESADAPLQHVEFLGNPDEDPHESFLSALLTAIPENACILTWNQVFEKMILRNLSLKFPDYAQELNLLRDNIRDLMIPFRQKHIYHRHFSGKYFLKSVLPVLIHDMDYDALDICDGQMASDCWMRMVHSTSAEERQAISEQLRIYCHQDTLAMVKILERMREIVSMPENSFH
jgi:hypothetical protein